MRSWTVGLAILAGLLGAAGVGLAAAGAHLEGGAIVTTAANIMLFHAAALIAICAAAAASPSGRGLLGAATILACGTILFSGEIALHVLAGVTGLRKAAPIGGGLMIVGWLGIAITLPIALGRSMDLR